MAEHDVHQARKAKMLEKVEILRTQARLDKKLLEHLSSARSKELTALLATSEAEARLAEAAYEEERHQLNERVAFLESELRKKDPSHSLLPRNPSHAPGPVSTPTAPKPAAAAKEPRARRTEPCEAFQFEDEVRRTLRNLEAKLGALRAGMTSGLTSAMTSGYTTPMLSRSGSSRSITQDASWHTHGAPGSEAGEAPLHPLLGSSLPRDQAFDAGYTVGSVPAGNGLKSVSGRPGVGIMRTSTVTAGGSEVARIGVIGGGMVSAGLGAPSQGGVTNPVQGPPRIQRAGTSHTSASSAYNAPTGLKSGLGSTAEARVAKLKKSLQDNGALLQEAREQRAAMEQDEASWKVTHGEILSQLAECALDDPTAMSDSVSVISSMTAGTVGQDSGAIERLCSLLARAVKVGEGRFQEAQSRELAVDYIIARVPTL